MELSPALLENLKTLRRDPFVQRRELMFTTAWAVHKGMDEESKRTDSLMGERFAQARADLVDALIGKGVAPEDAESMMQHIEADSPEAAKMVNDVIHRLNVRLNTIEARNRLPLHMRDMVNFATEPRLDASMQSLLGDAGERYTAMVRELNPRSAVYDHKVIGEVKKDEVILRFVGTSAVSDASHMRDMLNAVKKEFGITEGLFAGFRPGEAKRGQIYEAQVTLGAPVLKALLEAYTTDHEKFSAAAASVTPEGRSL